jgi:hypothetical protein
MSEKIVVSLDLESKDVDAELKTVETKAKKAGKKTGKNFGDGFENSVKGVFGGINTKLLGLAGTVLAGFTFAEIKEEVEEFDNATTRLASSLKATGDFTKENFKNINDYTAALSDATQFTQTALLSQTAFAKSMGASVEQSKEIVKAATDMAVALDIDLNSAVRNLSKTLGGYGGELSEIIPELKDLTKEQLQNGDAIDLLAKKYEGFAKDQAVNFSGVTKQISNAFGDILRTFGELVVKEKFITDFFVSVRDSLRNFNKELQGQGGALKDVTLRLINFAKAVNEFVVAPIELVSNIAKSAFAGINVAIQGVLTGLGFAGGKLADLLNKFGVDNDITKNLQVFRDSSSEVLDDLIAKSEATNDQLFNFDISAKAESFLENMESVVSASTNSANKIDEVFKSLNKGVNNSITETGKTVKKTVADISKTLQNGLLKAVVSTMQGLGASLAKGSFSFNDFKNIVLGIIGDMAIQIGSTLVGIGLGIEAIKASIVGLTAGPALAAGLSLIALGGLLKSLSGGGGGASAPSAGGAIGGEQGGGIAPTTITEQEQEVVGIEEEQEQREPQTVVNLTVQGDILDSQDTPARLAELIAAGQDDGTFILNEARA